MSGILPGQHLIDYIEANYRKKSKHSDPQGFLTTTTCGSTGYKPVIYRPALITTINFDLIPGFNLKEPENKKPGDPKIMARPKDYSYSESLIAKDFLRYLHKFPAHEDLSLLQIIFLEFRKKYRYCADGSECDPNKPITHPSYVARTAWRAVRYAIADFLNCQNHATPELQCEALRSQFHSWRMAKMYERISVERLEMAFNFFKYYTPSWVLEDNNNDKRKNQSSE